jgi:hypothetical protein
MPTPRIQMDRTKLLKEAIAVIVALPFPRSDVGDIDWERGVIDGRQEAVDAIRFLMERANGT